jgi:hypothetical protein
VNEDSSLSCLLPIIHLKQLTPSSIRTNRDSTALFPSLTPLLLIDGLI